MKNTVFLKLTTQSQEPTKKLLELYAKKYAEHKNLETLEQVEISQISEGGLNPLFGRIYSITLAYVSEGSLRVQILKGEEKDIISELLNTLTEHFSGSKIVTWNTQFTLPFITTRMAANRLPISTLAQGLKHQNKKPWEVSAVSVTGYCEGIGYYKSSLEEHAYNLGLECNVVSGEDVGSYLREEMFEEVDNSDVEYIYCLANIYGYFSGEVEIFEVSNVGIKQVGNLTVEQKPVLIRIYENKTISAEDEQELKELLGKKKISKKNKEILIDILHKLSLESDVFKKDSKDVVEEKLATATELINNL